jgi:Protein of unknown function (DUF2892)
MTNNLHPMDRFARLAFSLLLAEAAFFWLAGAAQLGAYVVASILLLTAVSGFCPLYKLAGIGTGNATAQLAANWKWLASGAFVVVVLLGAGYASNFFTKKLFLEDFNTTNNFYKQTLFHTGKSDRTQAVRDYESLMREYGRFREKYLAYRPNALRADTQFDADLARVGDIFAAARADVTTGDLPRAHLALEQARPILQAILKRNGFSLLAVALVDFHDAMELVIDAANAKDAAKVSALYNQVSDSLKAVEAQANDTEIQAIRKNLDGVLDLAKAAKTDALPAKADELKRSFVKVYLARG